MLLRARGQLVSRGDLLCEVGRFLARFFEQSRALRCFRLQLHIEPLGSASGLRRLLRQTFGSIHQGLLRFRHGHRRDLLHLGLLRLRWRAGLIEFDPSLSN